MEKIRRIVEGNDTLAGKVFDISVQSLIVVSLISFSIETLPHLSETTRYILKAIEIITVILFTIEYLLRIIVTQQKIHYIFSFFGLIDLFAILPFYIASGIDLRSIRAFRLLRLIRMFKLVRFSRAIRRFHKAFLLAREELILFFSVAMILFFFAAVGIYYFEHNEQPYAFGSIFHSLWWAVATLTTVGYGDVYPVTVGGKIFTFTILMIGLGIVAVPTGLMASALTEARRLEEDEYNKLS